MTPGRADAARRGPTTPPAMIRLSLLAAVAVSLSGCVGLGLDDLYRDIERWDPRTADSRSDRYGTDVRRDVDDYLRDVDRAVRLDRRQEQEIGRVLEDRAYDFERRSGRDRYAESPFPRGRSASRDVERWWDDTDRAIERRLERRQRDAYRDFVRRYDDRRYDRSGRRDTRWERRDNDDRDDDWDD